MSYKIKSDDYIITFKDELNYIACMKSYFKYCGDEDYKSLVNESFLSYVANKKYPEDSCIVESIVPVSEMLNYHWNFEDGTNNTMSYTITTASTCVDVSTMEGAVYYYLPTDATSSSCATSSSGPYFKTHTVYTLPQDNNENDGKESNNKRIKNRWQILDL